MRRLSWSLNKAENEDATRFAVASARTAARSAYYDFREIVRAAYRGLAERQALGVVGAIPTDTEKLLTLARSGYAAAGQVPYSAVLSGLGYNGAAKALREWMQTLHRITKVALRTRPDLLGRL